ncbi:hypothetical protein [Variovorax guangxiensis]|uniref:hypothetical protein n=1 Tax=Variovorax guangxiensis TaxID=1775474 RepID=UPI0028626FE6|nr:hypothetical protein [Variovorax guangxiensis]MDR6854442.1 hypothetical protein [Variovorax guangxiensis]
MTTTKNFHRLLAVAAIAACFSCGAAAAQQGAASTTAWQEEFGIADCRLLTEGRNTYFVLEPGYQLVLEGGGTKLQITVLDETKTIGATKTRVVEEREWKKGELYEVSRNYFAICEQTKDVFYFGEDVEFYKKGKVVGHDGSWHAGVNGSRAGLIMPGTPKLRMKYYQEIAPGVAMDRAEVVSLTETCKTPAGTFSGCLKVKEGSAIELLASEYKYHAPGIGLVRDEDLRLVRHGFIKNK